MGASKRVRDELNGHEASDVADTRPGKKARAGNGSVEVESLHRKLSKKARREEKEKRREDKKKRREEKKKRKEGRAQRKEHAPVQQEEETPAERSVNGGAPQSKTKSNGKKSRREKSAGDWEYHESSALKLLPQGQVDKFLKENFINILDPTPQDPPLRPILDFSHLPKTSLLSKSPFSAFSAPTPIQSSSWPYTLACRDAIGVAETGSGKTFAFALPLVECVSRSSRKERGVVRAVVVSPTRELAMQTHKQVEELAALVGLRCVCLFGGASKDTQRNMLGMGGGADVVVATPGRLKDFMSDGTVDLAEAQFVVLDEADRMLDKGFEEDIKMILGSTPPREKRQTLMFTATWPESVQALASSFMVKPVKITIGSASKSTSSGAVELQANTRISQTVEVVDPQRKESRLLELIKSHQQGKHKNDRILVFCLYKKEVSRVEYSLRSRGVRVASIQGDLRQEQRTKSLEAFKTGQTPVLVATDVAARGLDIPEVKLVINVTFPLTIEDYVHRIGRTGRAGKSGKAITLFTIHDKAHSGSLINILKTAGQPVPEDLLKFGSTVKKKVHPIYGAHFREREETDGPVKITFDDDD